ncbi:hypothetical protein L1987_47872 [Smallanthus sonchifolius]|uniref:Uncharacterized protein n=1 Tax=Smallanthus sonchifolius TaxID=185202 RepID=A0ACB9FQV6_9ASTR|nr:hypothetical protein L1987_47872 [Smallanthus sonchifolius]
MFLNPIHQLSPTNWADQAIAAADFICSNPFLEIKDATTNVTANTADTSPECLLSGTNSSTDDATDSKGLLSNNINAAGNNNGRISGGVSSGDSSQCSSGKRPITGVRVSDKPKRSRTNTGGPASSNINFQQPGNPWEMDTEAIAQMKAMIYQEAAFRPVSFAVETVVEKPKRKNVRISSDPQTVAARQRRERISERIRKMCTLIHHQHEEMEIGEKSTTIKASGTSPKSTKDNPNALMVVPFTRNPFFMHENL